MMRLQAKPMIMGAVMGPMMLWMLHGMLMGNGGGIWAALVFIAAHVVVATLIILSALFAGRLSTRFRAFTNRLHRPSLRHIAIMFASAALAALTVHLIIHGGL